MEGYCLNCREKRTIKDPLIVVMRNGKQAVQGTCAACGSRMYRIGFRSVSSLKEEQVRRSVGSARY